MSTVSNEDTDLAGQMDEEFQDCQTTHISSSNNSACPETTHLAKENVGYKNAKQRRTRIPNKPTLKICWRSLALSLGKFFPLGVYEPLTILQRSAQVFEYANLLHRAAELCDDPLAEMTYVVAFVLSGYISCSTQPGKPFNSLLGETFECDRMEDLGWRLVSEQVSSEPSTYAQTIEASDWCCHEQYTIKTQIKPYAMCAEGKAKGKSILIMRRSGHKYSWAKLPIIVKIRFSGVQIEHNGFLTISNETTGDACLLTFHGSQRNVTAKIKSKDGQVLEELQGYWDSHLETVHGESLWKRKPLDDGAMSYYGFSRFACQLNEPDETVAPTDSRRRKDVRYLEEGEVTSASEEKERLKRKNAKNISLVKYSPLWFDPPKNKNDSYSWNDKYWKRKEAQDWSVCPQLFCD